MRDVFTDRGENLQIPDPRISDLESGTCWFPLRVDDETNRADPDPGLAEQFGRREPAGRGPISEDLHLATPCSTQVMHNVLFAEIVLPHLHVAVPLLVGLPASCRFISSIRLFLLLYLLYCGFVAVLLELFLDLHHSFVLLLMYLLYCGFVAVFLELIQSKNCPAVVVHES